MAELSTLHGARVPAKSSTEKGSQPLLEKLTISGGIEVHIYTCFQNMINAVTEV